MTFASFYSINIFAFYSYDDTQNLTLRFLTPLDLYFLFFLSFILSICKNEGGCKSGFQFL